MYCACSIISLLCILQVVFCYQITVYCAGLFLLSVCCVFCRSSPDSTNSERLEMRSPGANMTAKDLFKTLVPLIRCDSSDMRETVVVGLGRINPEAFG